MFELCHKLGCTHLETVKIQRFTTPHGVITQLCVGNALSRLVQQTQILAMELRFEKK